MRGHRNAKRVAEIVRAKEPVGFELEFQLEEEGKYSFARFNRHHLLYTREQWDSSADVKRLRSSIGMIATLDIEAHQELHKKTGPVPLLDIYTARRVLNTYAPNPNPLQSIDNFSFAVQEAQKSPKSNRIERMLGDLTIFRLREQIPYVREGCVEAEPPMPVNGIIHKQWGGLGVDYMNHIGRQL